MKPTLLLLLVVFAAHGCSRSDSFPSTPVGALSISPTAISPSRTPADVAAAQGNAEATQLPFYARLQREFEPFHTDDWAVIAFYRQPSCVRPTFNLLDFVDASAAFACPQTVAGFAIFNEPLPAPPVQVNLTEAEAVPMWFVAWSELQAALADDVVTIGDLSSMSSLVIGSATNFREILHPNRKLTQIASGELRDGRTFQVEISAVVGTENVLKQVRIEFR